MHSANKVTYNLFSMTKPLCLLLSPQIRTTNQLTNLIKGSLEGVNIPLDNIYAFITSLGPNDGKVVGEMLASLNITSINLGLSLAHSPYALQMSPPPNVEGEALVQVRNRIPA